MAQQIAHEYRAMAIRCHEYSARVSSHGSDEYSARVSLCAMSSAMDVAVCRLSDVLPPCCSYERSFQAIHDFATWCAARERERSPQRARIHDYVMTLSYPAQHAHTLPTHCYRSSCPLATTALFPFMAVSAEARKDRERTLVPGTLAILWVRGDGAFAVTRRPRHRPTTVDWQHGNASRAEGPG